MNIQNVPKITKDVCANEKILRKLERAGHIELYINDMELPPSGSKISKYNSLPFGFSCSNPDCKCQDGIGGFGDGSVERPHSYWMTSEHEKLFKSIEAIIGSAHRRDCRQLFHHYKNERDIFVTEDTDILNFSERLHQELGIVVKTPEDLKQCFC
ncbi:MAG: hypothetical protein QNJ29_06535 [Rhizobiaceae bacterium]|nr:hypothetical protein [Rhizobiaceae bacterium]